MGALGGQRKGSDARCYNLRVREGNDSNLNEQAAGGALMALVRMGDGSTGCRSPGSGSLPLTFFEYAC